MSDLPQPDEPTIGRLVHDASRDISALVKKEIELAKSELKVSFQAGGTGIGLFAVAAFLVLLSIVMFSFFLAYLIHWNGDGLALQWAYLIVFGFYVLVAVILALLGVRSVKRVRGPERAIAQAQEAKAAIGRRSPR
ncbi:phage holin family protein [Nocardioides guangzhouensis]|uniref:Phage holin family protein n=1 Tax=Nocardioides guangzhouensis TaxID=2497878 RepID=A0A4V1XZM4_9ACTN|nr:phage holin family protein [Nocardioides guangzhouensis]RYP87259.1 phage holin family protein [Nocardioides guangzhouensis]